MELVYSLPVRFTNYYQPKIKDMELANALAYIDQRFGSTPVLITFTMVVVVILITISSLLGLRDKLLQFADRIDKWQLSIGTRIEIERDKLRQSKLVPCSVCGDPNNFYHPTKDVSQMFCICKKCQPFTYSKSCDLCGVSYLFYHPHGPNHDGLSICELCLSNREQYNSNWFPSKQDDSGKSYINN